MRRFEMGRRAGFMLAAVAIAALVIGASGAAWAATRDFTKTSTKPQNDSGGTFVPAHGANITVPDNPFSFTKASKIVRIDRIAITATITDGDTGPEDTERGDLLLVLDGVNTGIRLNGYRHAFTDRRTNSGVPINKREIRNKLRQDGELHATIRDRDPGPGQDIILPANRETTLVIKGEIRR